MLDKVLMNLEMHIPFLETDNKVQTMQMNWHKQSHSIQEIIK